MKTADYFDLLKKRYLLSELECTAVTAAIDIVANYFESKKENIEFEDEEMVCSMIIVTALKTVCSVVEDDIKENKLTKSKYKKS